MEETSRPVRTWRLRQERAPDRWVVEWLHEDGAEPIVCRRIHDESAAGARRQAEVWLASGGDVCQRWLAARIGWIAVTEATR